MHKPSARAVLPGADFSVAQSASSSTPTAHVIALSELSASASAQSAASEPLFQRSNPLRNVKATLQVCVGHATLSVGELLAAKMDHVVVLDRGVEQAVDLILEGQVVARGQLVAIDDKFAVRITQLPLPLALDAVGPT